MSFHKQAWMNPTVFFSEQGEVMHLYMHVKSVIDNM